MILTALLLFQFAVPMRAATANVIQPTAFALSRDSIRQMERRAFDLVNREREKKGLTALKWSDDLADVARKHSEEMAKFRYVEHTDREGREVAERARDAGLIDWRAIGENIAYNNGYQTPVDQAVAGWMTSEHHRDNILSDLWGETGIGVAVNSKGGYYFTQVFYGKR